MVNFRLYKNSDYLFNNLVIPGDKDWTSLEPMIFLGRYMQEKSTGILYRTWGSFQHPNFKTRGYNIKESLQDPHLGVPDHFPARLPSRGLKDIYPGLKHRGNITLDILFRNKEDYLEAEKELNICQTHVLEIPILLSQLKVCLPEINKRFENPVPVEENKEETLYFYKPHD